MLTPLVRSILGGLGVVSFYIGVTMTKNSEGRSENWLERKSREIRARGEGVLQLQAAFLRRVCENFTNWFAHRIYSGVGFFKLSVTICAVPNALVFLFVPRLWEPSIEAKIAFAVVFCGALWIFRASRWCLFLCSLLLFGGGFISRR